jgi:hypothetical protein
MFLLNVAKLNNTHGSSFIDEMTWDEDESYHMNLNYYTNENKNGKEVLDYNLKYYDSQSIAAGTVGTGIQFVGVKPSFKVEPMPGQSLGDLIFNPAFRVSLTNNRKDIEYYNTASNGVSYQATNPLNFGNSFLYDIDGKFIKIQQRAEPIEKVSVGFITGRIYSDIWLVLANLVSTLNSLPYGQQVLRVDLSPFFDIYMSEDGGSNFELITNHTSDYVFIKVAINKTANGLVTASQSLFGQVLGDTEFSLIGETSSYWKAFGRVTLDVSAFDYTKYGSDDFLCTAKINKALADYLGAFENVKITVNILLNDFRLSSSGILIYGLDHDFLRGLEFESVYIYSPWQTVLFCYADSLDTNFVTLNNVTLKLFGG